MGVETPFRKKSTRVTRKPKLGFAVAVRVVGELRGIVAPPDGAVNATLGVDAVIVTLTAEDVTVAELESVTRAVRENVPPADGVQSIV